MSFVLLKCQVVERIIICLVDYPGMVSGEAPLNIPAIPLSRLAFANVIDALCLRLMLSKIDLSQEDTRLNFQYQNNSFRITTVGEYPLGGKWGNKGGTVFIRGLNTVIRFAPDTLGWVK
ncbi:hypothetical protein K1T71_009406 [Dendrolimus kikuchii]|uniref:Uncharacterized protein n=1 Tax=Dendrolimus kikuchii TaxID=765133 RepID=A0ACC1CUY8_9NEOP|nr:hypothetical protein K1T71_009406 [Dendrolimus kikuchii]